MPKILILVVPYGYKKTLVFAEPRPNREAFKKELFPPNHPALTGAPILQSSSTAAEGKGGEGCKDSPNEHLEQGNIHPAHTRPALSVNGLVRYNRSTYNEPFDFKLLAVYSLYDEHAYEVGNAHEVGQSPAMVTFQAVPSTYIKTNKPQ
jgi:hypothetical protein